MSKISRKTLARGVKLAVQQVYESANEIIGKINSPILNGLDADNFAQPETPWSLHLNVPAIDSQFFAGGSGDQELCFPFIFLPPQDQYNDQTIMNAAVIRHTLKSVVISFDTRAEAAGIGDQFSIGNDPTDLTQGFARSDLSQDYVVSVRISEKLPVKFGGSAPYVSNRDVFSGTVDFSNSLAGDNLIIKINPLSWLNLSLQLDPYKTYIVRIACPALYDYCVASTNLKFAGALTSFNIQLNGSSTLVKRDMEATIFQHVQNIPYNKKGVPTADNVSTPLPSGGSTIYSDNDIQGGINTVFKTLDRVLSNRLKTGYGKDGNLPPVENMSFAGYHVIAVPMFQNFGPANRMTAKFADRFPFTTGLDGFDVIDRRLVMIEYPFTLHHVVAVQNFSSPPNSNRGRPSNYYPADFQQQFPGQPAVFPSLVNQIGVALGTGLRADQFSYQQIAFQNIVGDGSAVMSAQIDRFRQLEDGSLSYRPSLSLQQQYDFAMWSVPLVGTGGNGIVDQGHPIFIGRGSTPTFERTQVDGGRTETLGAEQWIEVRWAFRDDDGKGLLPDEGEGGGGSAPSPLTTYVGTGGHWVYLIGKKHPYDGKHDVKV